MIGRLRKLAVIGVLLAVLAVIGAPTPAQAVPPPSTWPTASQVLFTTNLNNINVGCPYHHGCAVVPYGNGWYVFKFYYYGIYYLSYWLGSGFVINYQSAGAAMRFYNSAGVQVLCLPAESAPIRMNWDPIWSIQLTASPC